MSVCVSFRLSVLLSVCVFVCVNLLVILDIHLYIRHTFLMSLPLYAHITPLLSISLTDYFLTPSCLLLFPFLLLSLSLSPSAPLSPSTPPLFFPSPQPPSIPDNILCYASVFQPLEWTLMERPAEVCALSLMAYLILFLLYCITFCVLMFNVRISCDVAIRNNR